MDAVLRTINKHILISAKFAFYTSKDKLRYSNGMFGWTTPRTPVVSSDVLTNCSLRPSKNFPSLYDPPNHGQQNIPHENDRNIVHVIRCNGHYSRKTKEDCGKNGPEDAIIKINDCSKDLRDNVTHESQFSKEKWSTRKTITTTNKKENYRDRITEILEYNDPDNQ